MGEQIKVLTVDDSGLMQKLLKSVFDDCPQIDHVGQALDCTEARALIKKYDPDLLTLDVEMPGMNGLEFLERLMNVRPMPVIMFSSHTAEGTDITLKALELGAVEFLQKPRMGLDKSREYLRSELIPKVLLFHKSNGTPVIHAPRPTHHNIRPSSPEQTTQATYEADTQHQAKPVETIASNPIPKTAPKAAISSSFSGTSKFDIIAIGSSTGGVTALREVLEPLPGNLPPIIITQHMPDGYIERFADRLNRDCAMTVVQASQNEELKKGHAYIAPATHHMQIVKRAGKFMIDLSNGAPVSGHRPSVDVMFKSLVAADIKGRALAVILTGMGRDGAQGMLELKNIGCPTIGQNKDTCIVYGMPRAAYELGAVDVELPLNKIPSGLLDVLGGAKPGSSTNRKAS